MPISVHSVQFSFIKQYIYLSINVIDDSSW